MKAWLDADPVGMGEYGIAAARGCLSVRGLGSCIAVVLHDPVAVMGGIAHVMLPSHTLARDQTRAAKFADTAIPLLLAELVRLGAQQERLVARLIGGARMFDTGESSGAVHMGERNVLACRAALEKAGVAVEAEDVGGDRGRSILYDVAKGTVAVRMLGSKEHDV
jgi:chemotaxis protein CheD